MTSLHQSIGATSFPLDEADFTDTLAPLDPSRDVMLAWFSAAINAELGTVWSKVATGTPLTNTSPVESTWPGPPSPEVMKQRKGSFPILFMSREGPGTIDEHTLWEERFTQNWTLDYVLDALAVDNFRRLGDALIAVVKILALTIRAKGHPAFESGALQLTDSGLSTLRIKGYQFGLAQFAGADLPAFHAASISIESTELQGIDDEACTPLQGVGFELGTGDEAGIIPNLIYADTEVPLASPAVADSVLYAGR